VKLNHVLREHYHIRHTTVQFEHIGCGELEGCVVPMEEMASSAGHGHHGHSH
jgi:cobalt-zinc-cadmium efflux system protein